MFKKVLVAVDSSRDSEAIFPHLIKLLQGTDGEVTVVTVEHQPRPAGSEKIVYGEVREAAGQFGNMPLQEQHVVHQGETRTQAIEHVEDERIKELTVRVRSLTAAGLRVECHALIGDHVADAIVDHARSGEYDLIAMATHGREGLSRLLNGSVAGHVVEKAPVPVLLVRVGL